MWNDKPKYKKGLLGAAIDELSNSLYVVKTNEPINRKEGNKGQADLEKQNAKSFKAAIGVLKKWDS